MSASTVTIRKDETPKFAPTDAVSASPAVKDVEPVKVVEPVKDVEPVKVVEPVKDSAPAAVEPAKAVDQSASTVVSTTTTAVANKSAVVKDVAAVSALVAPVVPRPQPGPIATVVISLLSAFGLLPPVAPVPVDVVGIPSQATPGTSNVNGVTGVVVGSSNLSIPVGTGTYTGAADWYFPTQQSGEVQAQGVTLLQHGFLGSKSWYSALAQDLAQRTNSIVVVPNIPSFGFFTCPGCTLSSVSMQQGVADLFIDPNRTALTASAEAAGYHGVLPGKFILTGHSAGGGLAAAAGGFYTDAVKPEDNDLLGVVMYDGVSSNGTFAGALKSLNARYIPIYQIAAPPQPWNANGQTTNDLVAAQKSGQFVGVVLANGSHVDSLIGGSPIIDFFSQLFIKPSPPGNTQAVYTLANGWINDFYAGLGPTDQNAYGTYGRPDQYLVFGPTAGVVLGAAPVVDLNRYLGTWYEVGSVKQFFSLGLVNTTAVYTANTDGSIGVENSGNYFFDNGPQSRIFGTALPVSAAEGKLNVTFFGPPSATPPGNYWIVDRAPDYSWAIVSDPTGNTGFLLSRTRTVSYQLYQQLLDRASVKGVKGWITVTPQPAAARELSSTIRV
ncbi:lipocalin family protein [Mycobacterium sp. NPDC006124]|uniref:lipocalin family protein n=1 Tax=Mycobacterium sp. NPDC006124 TaxID=3156729 RepID=UPI0033B54C64